MGGSVAQLAMDDCFNKFIKEEKVKSAIRQNTYMDDVSILNNDPDVSIQSIVRTVDGALAQGSFKIKHWVCAGDTETVKFLSYHYEAHTDTFCVKPVINWSPRHRGARRAPDITTHADLVEYIASNLVTKRHVASMVMGTMFDSLQIFCPYRTNLKFTLPW